MHLCIYIKCIYNKLYKIYTVNGKEHQVKYLVYLPIAIGIASNVSYFTFDNVVLGEILGIIGFFTGFKFLEKYESQEDLCYWGITISFFGVYFPPDFWLVRYFS